MDVVSKALQKQLNAGIGTILPQEGVLGDLLVSRKVLIRGNYKFSRDGGAISTINLKDVNGDTITLPAGLIVNNGMVVCKTAVTSAGAVAMDIGVAAGAEFTSGTLKAALDLANEKAAIIPVGSAATAVVLAAAGLLTVKVATATITAGEFDVFLEGYYRE